MASILDRFAAGVNRLAHAWNAFANEEERHETQGFNDYGPSYGRRPDQKRLSSLSDQSIIASVYTRLGVDVASADMRHVKLDASGRYSEDMTSGLNNCLTVEANIDQAARQFRQDIAMTMFENGMVAVVPIDTSLDPNATGAYQIDTLRCGIVSQFYARHVKVRLWNDRLGRFEEVIVSKTIAALVENPFYSVMNEPNGTLQRLLRKLKILDAVDEASSSGKLDIIIQLPYTVRSDAKKAAAETRIKDIEMQLKGSMYGIAYADATEKITQLNRPAENQLLAQIKYLTEMLYGQLGLTEAIFNGEASESAMLNYHNRTIAPVLEAIVEAMRRTFLTKTARTQGQSILYFRDPFKLVAIKDLAQIMDVVSRNEILTPNEIRGVFGFKPNSDPKSDMLINSNMTDTTSPELSDSPELVATPSSKERDVELYVPPLPPIRSIEQ